MRLINQFIPSTKQVENSKVFTLKSFPQQFLEYYINNNLTIRECDITHLLHMELSAKLSYEDVQIVIKQLLHYKPINYELLLEGIKQKSFVHVSKMQNELFDDISSARNSLDIGDFIAYLIGKKLKLSRSMSKEVEPYLDISSLLDHIDSKLIQTITELSYELADLETLPLKRVHYLFFIHPKAIAIDLFTKEVALKIAQSSNPNVDFGGLLTSSRFFERLQLEFIPNVSAANYKSTAIFENEDNEFITKDELFRKIDTQEWHHTLRPLAYLDSKYLINPEHDVKDYTLLSKIMRDFFKKILPYEDENIFDVFYSNITRSYPNKIEYLDSELIYVRDTIKAVFFEGKSKPNEAFYEFCAIIYHLNGATLLNLTKRLPVLMEAYLGNWASSHTISKCCFREIESIPTLAASIRRDVSV